MALTDVKCRAKWDGKDRMLGDGGGLYLNVRRKSKTWIVRRTRGGSKRVITLGHYPDMSLAAARREAVKLDPGKHGSTRTVEDLVADYRAIIERDNKRPHITTGYLDRGISPALLKMRIADVARTDLVAAIREYPIAITGRTGTRARDAFRGILRQMFGLAVEQGDIDTSPAEGITARVTGYKPKDRARVLSDDEIRALWAQDGDNARLLRFLLLTGVRIGEAQQGAPWDADGREWAIPAALSKNGDPHWVYLTDTAAAQVRQPFRMGITAAQAWCRRWCERQGFDPAFTPHDCRRTFSTRLNDAGAEPYVVEKCLNHRMQGVMAVYNHAEYREQRIEAYKVMERLVLEVVR